MDNNEQSWLFLWVGVIFSLIGYILSNVGLSVLAFIAIVVSIYKSDVIKRNKE